MSVKKTALRVAAATVASGLLTAGAVALAGLGQRRHRRQPRHLLPIPDH